MRSGFLTSTIIDNAKLAYQFSTPKRACFWLITARDPIELRKVVYDVCKLLDGQVVLVNEDQPQAEPDDFKKIYYCEDMSILPRHVGYHCAYKFCEEPPNVAGCIFIGGLIYGSSDLAAIAYLSHFSFSQVELVELTKELSVMEFQAKCSNAFRPFMEKHHLNEIKSSLPQGLGKYVDVDNQGEVYSYSFGNSHTVLHLASRYLNDYLDAVLEYQGELIPLIGMSGVFELCMEPTDRAEYTKMEGLNRQYTLTEQIDYIAMILTKYSDSILTLKTLESITVNYKDYKELAAIRREQNGRWLDACPAE